MDVDTNDKPNSGKTGALTLADILDGKADQFETPEASRNGDQEDNEQENGAATATVPEGLCVECESHPAEVHCEQCCDDFCGVCCGAVHRKGTRRRHVLKRLKPDNRGSVDEQAATKKATKATEVEVAEKDVEMSETIQADELHTDDPTLATTSTTANTNYFLERSKYIPLRLTLDERKFLRLLEAALGVSEYTDKIDIISYSSRPKRIVAQIKELCAIISGLVVAADYQVGQALFQDRDFEQNAEFYQDIFELGRRHKIMNPDRMRGTYGKLIYMLQDAQISEVKEMLGFDCVRPLKTVYNVLAEANCLDLLTDPLITPATMEILSQGKSRYQVQEEIRQKERAIEKLARRYSKHLDAEKIRNCLYSVGDNHSYLRWNRDPCDKMIAYLEKYFSPDKIEQGHSLAIQSGRGGARLSHDHSKQYTYVIQSLTLWREILHEMFMLWSFSETDLLEESNMYRLRDTGQGLNRVQACPRVGRTMQAILGRAQRKVGYWVGSSVIHLGDHNVPNALLFIDKYTQISRILNPICRCIEEIDNMLKNEGLASYIETTFGGAEKLKKDILTDFFRHAFDGSGADNFFDAGSCIDGRLTSAWNWANLIEKKVYFPVFLLSGFVGFDGKVGE